MKEETVKIIEYKKSHPKESNKTIAAKMGLPYATVRNAITHYTPRARERLRHGIDVAPIRDMIRANMTIKEIAKKMRVNPKSLYYLLRREGIRLPMKDAKIIAYFENGVDVPTIAKELGLTNKQVYEKRRRWRAKNTKKL